MASIRLTRGFSANIDDSDVELVSRYRWQANRHHAGGFYARGDVGGRRISMHRLLLGVTDPSVIVDHINGDQLDNRRENLRIVTASQSCINRRVLKNNQSGFAGVGWYAPLSAWRARICRDGKRKHLGYFPSLEDAVIAYENAASILHGEYRRAV